MTALKQKLKVKTRTEQQVDVRELAEQYIDLEKQIKKIAAKMSPLEQQQADIKKQILEQANATLGEDEELLLAINGSELKIGKRGSSRTITDIEKAIEFIGVDVFLRVAKVSMADLDAYLTPPELEQVVTTTRTDTRIIKVR